MTLLVRLLLMLGGLMATAFVARDAPNFDIVEGMLAMVGLVAIVAILALTTRS